MLSVTICTFNVENLFGRYKVFGYMPGDQFKLEILKPDDLEEKGGFLPGQMLSPENWTCPPIRIVRQGDNREKVFFQLLRTSPIENNIYMYDKYVQFAYGVAYLGVFKVI